MLFLLRKRNQESNITFDEALIYMISGEYDIKMPESVRKLTRKTI